MGSGAKVERLALEKKRHTVSILAGLEVEGTGEGCSRVNTFDGRNLREWIDNFQDPFQTWDAVVHASQSMEQVGELAERRASTPPN